MGGVQSGTHNFGDALWIQERERQKYHREGSRCEGNSHGVQSQYHQQYQTSTQERRKLLKCTRSLAVISENDSCIVNHDRNALRLGTSFDTSSLQHRRPQLIPRAKLIDRNAFKDRLCKSQQHLTDSYERFSEVSARVSQTRSVCGLYSLPPPLESLPHPLSNTQAPVTATCRPITESSGRLNILEWPKSPRRYRSVQDLNSVGGFVDIVENNYWPAEENRSLDCIYTQVKRKRKEHRSLDSILCENDSDELEYFDILNLLPLSNVRLEIDEPNSKNNSVILERSSKVCPNQKFKSHSTVLSVVTKDSDNNSDKCSMSKGGISITEIEEFPLKINSDKQNKRSHENLDILKIQTKKSAIEKNIISFNKLAKEKHQFICTSDIIDSRFDGLNKRDSPQSKSTAELSQVRVKKEDTYLNKQNKLSHKDQEIANLYLEKNQNINKKIKIKETIKKSSLLISDIKETEEMSRRPQILKIIDNDITKPKIYNSIKLIDLDVKSCNNDITCTDFIYENIATSQESFKRLNKSDRMNDRIYETKIIINSDFDTKTTMSSVENTRNFFEKKSIDKDLSLNQHNEVGFDRSVEENSSTLNKRCNVFKGSLEFEARSESSDLGFGSEIDSDIRRLSIDENINILNEKYSDKKKFNTCINKVTDSNTKNEYNSTNLTRSQSCIDSIESQASDEPEFDHVRYKIIKSKVFSKNIFNNSKNDGNYDELMQYLREYSFQDLLLDKNVIIIEPVRAEVERKSSFNETKSKSSSIIKSSQLLIGKIDDVELQKLNEEKENSVKNHLTKAPRQSSLRKHFFYQPIRVNRELNDDELPDPDTVKNVRNMFEETMKRKLKINSKITRNYNTRNSISMKDLRTIENGSYETGFEKAAKSARSSCSSQAKDLRKMFENLDKSSSPISVNPELKDNIDNIRNASKTKTIVQSFENKSGHTSPSNSNSSKSKANKYHQRQLYNWDTGSVSSGVSSDYPDTDAGSALPCISSEDEELYCHDDDGDDGNDERCEGHHYVSQDVLKKIREYGTSVTYYGGKVINTYNRPLICPMVCKTSKECNKSLNYIKFRLIKSNSCDSRLELTGRIDKIRNKYKLDENQNKVIDLRHYTIDEAPSIEITSIEQKDVNEINIKIKPKEEKRELPVVIGLEPKKEENKTHKAQFKVGKLDDCTSTNKFTSALTRWQINENIWKRTLDFEKMEFEEYEVLEDSINGLNI